MLPAVAGQRTKLLGKQTVLLEGLEVGDVVGLHRGVGSCGDDAGRGDGANDGASSSGSRSAGGRDDGGSGGGRDHCVGCSCVEVKARETRNLVRLLRENRIVCL